MSFKGLEQVPFDVLFSCLGLFTTWRINQLNKKFHDFQAKAILLEPFASLANLATSTHNKFLQI